MVYNALESKILSLLSTRSKKWSKSENSSQSEHSSRYIYFLCHHISSMFKRTSLSILTSRLNSDKIQNKYYIWNSKNSNSSDSQRLFNLSDKINLKRSDKHIAFLNLSIYYT